MQQCAAGARCAAGVTALTIAEFYRVLRERFAEAKAEREREAANAAAKR